MEDIRLESHEIRFIAAEKMNTTAEGIVVQPLGTDECQLLFSVNGELWTDYPCLHIGKQQACAIRLKSPICVYDDFPIHTLILIRFNYAESFGKGDCVGGCVTAEQPAIVSTKNVYRLLVEILYESFRQGVDYKEHCTILLAIILDRLQKEISASKRNDEERVERVRFYLMEHFTEMIRLEDLAKRFWVSVSQLQKEFKQSYNLTVIAWLNWYRYQIARNCIDNEDMPLREAMIHSGISGRQQYYRLKKKWGNCDERF